MDFSEGRRTSDGQCKRGQKLQIEEEAVIRRGGSASGGFRKEWGFMGTELNEGAKESDRRRSQ